MSLFFVQRIVGYRVKEFGLTVAVTAGGWFNPAARAPRLRAPISSTADTDMDSGKVEIKIPADLMTLEAVGAVADKIQVALRRGGLGEVVSHYELTFEPFTPGTPEFGRRWHQIVLKLDMALESRRLADLLFAAGTPPAAHVTYTDQMRLCGDSLGRVLQFARPGAAVRLGPNVRRRE